MLEGYEGPIDRDNDERDNAGNAQTLTEKGPLFGLINGGPKKTQAAIVYREVIRDVAAQLKISEQRLAETTAARELAHQFGLVHNDTRFNLM